MLLRHLSLIILVLLSFSIVNCKDDDDVISGRIKTVYSYNNDYVLRKKESYNYNAEGKLVKEVILIDNTTEFTREFFYDGSNIIKMTERNYVVEFTYNNEGKIHSIFSQPYGFSFTYEGGQLKSASNFFNFNFDKNQNITSITNADKSLFYMAKGLYEYDDKKNIYNSFPEPLRLYFALFRSEQMTLSSGIFRFNTGPNNIMRNNHYNTNGELEHYYLFRYEYQKDGFPTKLNLERYNIDQEGNSKLHLTYYYVFEYY